MSDNIPFEIQSEIIHRIPDTKSLIRFRSVSKAWKSVIDSPEFVTAHTLRHRQARNHLLIRRQDYGSSQVKYVSIVDDDVTFPHQKHNVVLPDSVKKLSHNSKIVGSSHGLFCLYDSETSTAVIWNPSIRKTVSAKVPKPNVRGPYYWTVVGFGICPVILDPKLVKITHFDWTNFQDVNTDNQVEVFSLSSGGTWRSPLSSNVLHKSIRFRYSRVAIDGYIYWVASDWVASDDGFGYQNLIMSFDLTSEEFTKVNLPGPLAFASHACLSLSNLRESLAIFEFDIYTGRRSCNVWMMIGHGCTRSFNKLYSIDAPDASIVTILGFRKNGTPIIAVENYKEGYHESDELATYEPESKRITNIGIYGMGGSFFVHSYMETLLLLGH